MKKKLFLNYLIYSAFFPVYFSIKGVYYPDGEITRGLILPFVTFAGLYAFLLIFINCLLRRKKIIRDEMITYIFILFYIMLMHTLVGYVIYRNNSIFFLNAAYLASIIGISLAVWLVNYRKIEVDSIFYSVSIVFAIAIILNIIFSSGKIGFQDTLSRSIYPATHLGGIYHTKVYFPFIVSMVFLFALPLWKKYSYLLFIPIYVLVSTYILMLQVRGATITYVLGFTGYFLLFGEKNKIKNISLVVLVATFVSMVGSKNMFFSRFSSGGIISGRESIWSKMLINLIQDPFYIIRGSFSKSAKHSLDVSLDAGISSYHNQYIEFFDSYGAFVTIFFIYLILYFLMKCYRLNKKTDTSNSACSYWLFLIILHFVVDLNVNVPLRVPGVCIIYMFYWTSYYLLLKNNLYIFRKPG